MDTPFSFSKPSTTDLAQFQGSAESSFINFLGFTSCSVGIQPTALVTIRNVTTTSQPLTSLLLTNTTAPPSSSSSPDRGKNQKNVRVAVGVTVPIGSVAALVLGIFFWRNYQRRCHSESGSQSPRNPDDSMAFPQQKEELEAEQRRHEMHEDVRLELETRETRPELHGGRRWQELRSQEHSRELEASTR